MGTARRHNNSRARKNHRTGATQARRLLVLSALILALGLTSVVATTSFDGASLATAAVQRAKSFLQLIQQRSPGTRTKAILVKTKHKRVVVHERALPKIRLAVPNIPPAIPSIYAPALVDLLTPPIPMLPASLEALTIPPPSPASSPPSIPLVPPPHIIVPPPQSPSTTPLVPPPSAVPEPATWLTMLLGFGLIGWQLRRRRVERKLLHSG
jgi:hypothetical protein